MKKYMYNKKEYLKLKRLIDVVLAVIGLMVSIPIMIVIAIAIKKEEGWRAGIFFKQKRVGINKSHFWLYKIRTMSINTPHDMPTHLLDNPEQYITKVGKILRKTSLDELPQFWNVYIGDMSMVGPRPALWNQYDLIEERDKYGANDVRPGVTGWAQVNGRDELEIPQKAKLDGEYVKKMSLLFDIKCLMKTVTSVLRKDGIVEGRR